MKIIFSFLILFSGVVASAQADESGAMLIESVLRCQANGVSIVDCGANGPRILKNEIGRCDLMNVNLIYCLTTSPDATVSDSILEYAQGAWDQKLPLRTALRIDERNIVNDRVGRIDALLRCEANGVSPKECLKKSGPRPRLQGIEMLPRNRFGGDSE